MVLKTPDSYSGQQVPFHLTSLVGLRSFKLRDDKEHLISPVYTAEWTEGVNVAKCEKPEVAWDFVEGALRTIPPHNVGSLVCKCGFYNYFDDSQLDYYDERRYKFQSMVAIVEGWAPPGSGRLTFGERGFRSSHARIVALVEPATHVRPPAGYGELSTAAELWPRIRHNYETVPCYPTLLDAISEHPLRGVNGDIEWRP